MKVTRVFELKTQEDIERLCKTLKRLKRRSAALRYTVAVTADRPTVVKELANGTTRKRDLIEGILDRLSEDL